MERRNAINVELMKQWTVAKHMTGQAMRRSGGGSWRRQFELSENPERLLPFPGQYGPDGKLPVLFNTQMFIPWYKHPRARKPGTMLPCTCGNGTMDTPCVYHWWMNSANADAGRALFGETEDADRAYVKFISRLRALNPVPAAAVNFIHVRGYHEVEVTNELGKKFKVLEVCTGRRCERCAKGESKVLGKIVYLNLARKHWLTFLDWDRRISRKCTNCGGNIIPVKATCPSCHTALDLPDAMLPKLELDPYRCPHCGETKQMELLYECWKDEETKGCSNQSSLSVWECILSVAMLKTGENQKTLNLTEWEAFRLAEYEGQAERLEKLMQHPLDLKFLVEMTTAEQANILGGPDPYVKSGKWTPRPETEEEGAQGGSSGGEGGDDFPF